MKLLIATFLLLISSSVTAFVISHSASYGFEMGICRTNLEINNSVSEDESNVQVLNTFEASDCYMAMDLCEEKLRAEGRKNRQDKKKLSCRILPVRTEMSSSTTYGGCRRSREEPRKPCDQRSPSDQDGDQTGNQSGNQDGDQAGPSSHTGFGGGDQNDDPKPPRRGDDGGSCQDCSDVICGRNPFRSGGDMTEYMRWRRCIRDKKENNGEEAPRPRFTIPQGNGWNR